MTPSLLLSSGVPSFQLAGCRTSKPHFQAFRPCSASRGHSTASPMPRGAAQGPDADTIAEHEGAMCRRSLLAGLSSLALCAACMPAFAGEELVPYEDARDKFRISIPAGWIAAQGAAAGNKGFTGASGSRRALAWYPQSSTDTNVTVIITNVGADYTSLGSFGTAETFGANLVSQMDRSFLLRSGFNRPKSVQVAKLLDARARSNMFFLEYTVQKPDEDQPRHFVSAVSLGYNGRYNRMYTVTGQCVEADVASAKGMLEGVLSSFQPPAVAV